MYRITALILLQLFLLFSCKSPEPILSDAVIWSTDFKTDSCIYKQKLEFFDLDKNGYYDFLKNTLYKIKDKDTVVYQTLEGKAYFDYAHIPTNDEISIYITRSSYFRLKNLIFDPCTFNPKQYYDHNKDTSYTISNDSVIYSYIGLIDHDTTFKSENNNASNYHTFCDIAYENKNYILYFWDEYANGSFDRFIDDFISTIEPYIYPDNIEDYTAEDMDVSVTEIAKNGIIEIRLGRGAAKLADRYEIYDLTGNIVLKDSFNKRQLIQINVSGLQRGSYVLKMYAFIDYNVDKTILIP